MSDHAILGALLALCFITGIGGLLVMAGMLRECQRLTRAVAGMVCQEAEKTRAALTGHSQP